MIAARAMKETNSPRVSTRGRTATGSPNPIDVHVGSRVRLRRTLLGMSQEKLGDAIGLTFQQVQKYERGANRIGASRLWDLSRVLDVPVSFFFDDMIEGTAAQSPRMLAGTIEEPSSFEADPMSKRETLELVRAYYRITDPQVRKRVFELAKALASASEATRSLPVGIESAPLPIDDTGESIQPIG
ncbi:Transcriptional regulator [invertebrate metagenome]|uniref:Transcriptional regulator n=1 Tax=invertebrate metagenome TaxID=1711999 RepID=A0A484H778_9ZZZZ